VLPLSNSAIDCREIAVTYVYCTMSSGMLNAADLSPRLVIIVMLGTFHIADGSKTADGNIGYCDVPILSALGGGGQQTDVSVLRPCVPLTTSNQSQVTAPNHAVSNLCLPVPAPAGATDSQLIDWAFNKLECRIRKRSF